MYRLASSNTLRILTLLTVLNTLAPAAFASVPTPQPRPTTTTFTVDTGGEFGVEWHTLGNPTFLDLWYQEGQELESVDPNSFAPYDVVERGTDRNGTHYDLLDNGQAVGTATVYPSISNYSTLTINTDGMTLFSDDPLGEFGKEPATGTIVAIVSLVAAGATWACSEVANSRRSSCDNDKAWMQAANPEKTCLVFDDGEIGCWFECWVVCFDAKPELI